MSVVDKLFRRHEETIWSQLQAALDGNAITKVDGRDDKIMCTVEDWTVLLDLHFEGSYRAEFVHTRFRTFYAKAEYFNFSVHHRSWTDRIAGWIGFHEEDMGDSDFADAYVVKSNDPERIRKVFANDELRQLMTQEDDLLVSLGPVGPANADGTAYGAEELRLMVHGKIKDPERVRRLYRIFCLLLHELFLVFSSDLAVAKAG